MAQNVENFCLLYLLFQEPYIICHMILIYGTHACIKGYLQAFFFFFSKFWYLGSLGGGRVVKGEKMAQNDKMFCWSHSVSQELYVIWLWFLMHMCKMLMSPANFFIFQNFDFWVFQGDKGQKMNRPKITNFRLFCSLSQELQRILLEILIMVSTGVFLCFFFLEDATL